VKSPTGAKSAPASGARSFRHTWGFKKKTGGAMVSQHNGETGPRTRGHPQVDETSGTPGSWPVHVKEKQ